MGRLVLAAWLMTVACGYVALGRSLARLVEGYDRSSESLLPVALTVVALLASIMLTIRWARGLENRTGEPGRRRFLLGALGAAGGLVATLVATFARVSGIHSSTAAGLPSAISPFGRIVCPIFHMNATTG